MRWRNANWYREMNRWCYFIDFWMSSGMLRNTTERGPEWDFHCNNSFHANCTPRAIIQFEKLYSENEAVGIAETIKLAEALDVLPNVTMIENEARPCVYREVMNRPEFYNRNRDGNGPQPEMLTFHYTQLWHMWKRLEFYKEKYSSARWLDNPNAVTLVQILDEYISEVSAEYDLAASEYYDAYGFIY